MELVLEGSACDDGPILFDALISEDQAERVLKSIHCTEYQYSLLSNYQCIVLTQEQIVFLRPLVDTDITVYENVILRRAIWVDKLSYKVHTNREVTLLQERSKPLAVFLEAKRDGAVLESFPEGILDELVEKQHVQKSEFVVSGSDDISLRYVCYYLPQEEWRFPAYKALVDIGSRFGWDDGLTRMQGLLLGYSHAQTSEFLLVRDKRK